MSGTAAEIRRQNVFDVLRTVHAESNASRKGVAGRTGLSTATVSSVVTELQHKGLVTETPVRRQVAGRPAAELSLNPEHGVFVGVDIAETYVHAEAYDAALGSLRSVEVELDPAAMDPSAVIAAVSETVSRLVHTVGSEAIRGVGLSAPGQVDRAGGTSIFAPNWNWRGVPLLDALHETIPFPLSLDNPLKLLTVAELWSERSIGSGDFAVLNLGTGIGAGLCIDRQVFRGRTNSAGELGHCLLVPGGRSCRCGSRGCIEAYVGAPGMIATISETYPELLAGGGTTQKAGLSQFADAVRAEEPRALLALSSIAQSLGVAIATLINLFNPGRVVLGGWVSTLMGDILLESALPFVREYALEVPFDATTFGTQVISGNPVSLGAAYAALESYLDTSSLLASERVVSRIS